MPRITILYMGKSKEPWLREALATYTTRLRPHLDLHCTAVPSAIQLQNRAQRAALAIALDPRGERLDSATFASRLQEWLVQSGAHLTFVIGGADGLPDPLQKPPWISLSALTYPHHLARLVLVEQLYRATQIALGTPYHRARHARQPCPPESTPFQQR